MAPIKPVKTCDPVKLHDMALSFNNKAETGFANNMKILFKIKSEPIVQGLTLTHGRIDDACIIFDVHNAFEQILKGLEFIDTTKITGGHKLYDIYAKLLETSRRDLSKLYAGELVKLRLKIEYKDPAVAVYVQEQEFLRFAMMRKDPVNVQERELIYFPNTFEWFLSRLDDIKTYTQRYSYQHNIIHRCCYDFKTIFDVFNRMYNYSVKRWAPSMSGSIDASSLHTDSIIDIVKGDDSTEKYADEQGNCILIAHEPKRKANASFRSRYVQGVEEYFFVKNYSYNMDDTASDYYNYGNLSHYSPWEGSENKQVLPFTVENCSSKEQAVKALNEGKKPLFYPAFFLDEVYSVGNDDW